MTKRRGFAVALLLVVFALVAAACSSDSDDTTTTTAAGGEDTTTTTAAATTTTAAAETTTTGAALPGTAWCEVTDVGGVDDKSFNQLAFDGAEAAAALYGGEARVLESQSETDYESHISSFVNQGDCDLIVTVGFLLGDATATGAATAPDQPFAIIDFAYDPTIENVSGLVFAIDQAAFLAGYVAADQTQTGVVGTFGGVNIQPVTAFMEGFALGAAYYNDQKGTDVTVLGWDVATQDGLFTGNFESLDDGRAFAESLADEGADIILPVAGPVGLGAAALVQERGLRIIGVDADWLQTAPEFSDVILTSILKKIDIAVLAAARAVIEGTFAGGVLVSTLESEGVGIASVTNPYTDDISTLNDELVAVAAGIIDGSIDTSTQN